MPDPRPGRRCVYHIVGASGAGKSTVAADFAENFAEMFPNNKTIIISGDEAEDPAFEGVEHERVKASAELNEIPINELCADVDGTLLIFDDVEAIPDKADRLALESFANNTKLYFGESIPKFLIENVDKMLSRKE
jgi:ABC-type dipeptide/oligopeptide/nickel transport system ATPase component